MMPKYRIRAYYRTHGSIGNVDNLYKVQQKCWWGWKTVAKRLDSASTACDIIRDLKIAHYESRRMNDAR